MFSPAKTLATVVFNSIPVTSIIKFACAETASTDKFNKFVDKITLAPASIDSSPVSI
jgi:hypothetical protein